MDKANHGFTFKEQTAISRAFDAGNFAAAYETSDIEDCDLGGIKIVERGGVFHEVPRYTEHERHAFVLGFFSSYSLDEIGSDREIFDEAYRSPAGRYAVQIAKYTDDRADEYAAEENEGF